MAALVRTQFRSMVWRQRTATSSFSDSVVARVLAVAVSSRISHTPMLTLLANKRRISPKAVTRRGPIAILRRVFMLSPFFSDRESGAT
ncbi:hypothetical protein D3C72_2284880 [compost metagenome]